MPIRECGAAPIDLGYCLANNIILCRLPLHTSHKLQLCDIAVFGPLKITNRDNVERIQQGGVNSVGKEHFTSLYRPARETTFTKRNILAGWSKAGLFPFNPMKVLRDTSDPLTELTNTHEVKARLPVLQETALQSPVRPVSAEVFKLLQDLIVERDAHALDETNKPNLQRHLQKLAKAAQMSFTKGTLQQDQIEFLLNINDEAEDPSRLPAFRLG